MISALQSEYSETKYTLHNNTIEIPISTLFEFLKTIPLFKQAAVTCSKISKHIDVVQMKHNQRLFSEGQAADAFYIVYKGTLDVLNDHGKKLCTLESQEYTGELSLITGQRRTANVTVSSNEAILFIVTKKYFDRYLKNDTQILLSFIKESIGRLKKTNTLILSRTYINDSGIQNLPICDLEKPLKFKKNPDLTKYAEIIHGSLLKPISLEKLKSISKLAKAKTNYTLIKKGDEGQHVYFILKGRVSVYTAKDDRFFKIIELEAGKAIGWMSIFSDCQTCASVKTDEDCVLIKINHDAFKELQSEFPALSHECLLDLADQIKVANKRDKYFEIKLNSSSHSSSPFVDRKDKWGQLRNLVSKVPKINPKSIEAYNNFKIESFETVEHQEIIEDLFKQLPFISRITINDETLILPDKRTSLDFDEKVAVLESILQKLCWVEDEIKGKNFSGIIKDLLRNQECPKSLMDYLQIIKLCSFKIWGKAHEIIQETYPDFFGLNYQAKKQKEISFEIKINSRNDFAVILIVSYALKIFSLTEMSACQANRLKPKEKSISLKDSKDENKLPTLLETQKYVSMPHLSRSVSRKIGDVIFYYTIKKHSGKEKEFLTRVSHDEPALSQIYSIEERKKIESIFANKANEITKNSPKSKKSEEKLLSRLSQNCAEKNQRRNPSHYGSLLYIEPTQKKPFQNLLTPTSTSKHNEKTFCTMKSYKGKDISFALETLEVAGTGGSGKVLSFEGYDIYKRDQNAKQYEVIFKQPLRDGSVSYDLLLEDLHNEFCTLKRLNSQCKKSERRNIQKTPYGAIIIPIDGVPEIGLLGIKYEGGNLLDFLTNHPQLTNDQIITLSRVLLNTLIIIHNKKLAHFDIKLENIFMSHVEDGEIFGYTPIYGDYGSSRYSTEDGRPLESLFTMTTCLPRNIDIFNQHKRINEDLAINDAFKIDIFNLGLMLYQIAAYKLDLTQPQSPKFIRKYPYPLMNLENINAEDFDITPLIENKCPENLITAIQGMCHPDMDKRMGLKEALNLI